MINGLPLLRNLPKAKNKRGKIYKFHFERKLHVVEPISRGLRDIGVFMNDVANKKVIFEKFKSRGVYTMSSLDPVEQVKFDRKRPEI